MSLEEKKILASMTKEELEIYRFLVCQYCGKKMTRSLMERRRKEQQFPVCQKCLPKVLELGSKLVKMREEMQSF